MLGSATFVTVLSSITMNRAKHMAASVHQRRFCSVRRRRRVMGRRPWLRVLMRDKCVLPTATKRSRRSSSVGRMTDDAIVVEGLAKSYGSVRALCGVDFTARTGSVLGLLGPNGAGKTTAGRVRP